jgi:hypothetical protein
MSELYLWSTQVCCSALRLKAASEEQRSASCCEGLHNNAQVGPGQLAGPRVAVQDAVAIKFFTDPAGFANEQRAYGMKAVAEAVGTRPTFFANEDRAAVMPNGWPFPPFTVSEKGQPLHVWMNSYSADPVTSMQVSTLP